MSANITQVEFADEASDVIGRASSNADAGASITNLKRRKTMETNDYVSYELALKLKERGFNWKTDHLYRKDADNGDQYTLIHSGFDDYNAHWSAGDWCSAPSLYVAQKWLREEKEIFVEVTSDALYDWDFFVMELDEDANIGVVRNSEIYSSYEKALSVGIAAALELIER